MLVNVNYVLDYNFSFSVLLNITLNLIYKKNFN